MASKAVVNAVGLLTVTPSSAANRPGVRPQAGFVSRPVRDILFAPRSRVWQGKCARFAAVCSGTADEAKKGDTEGDTNDALAAEFARLLLQKGVSDPVANRQPTALMPPTAVVSAVMNALMRNDYPDENCGIAAAFAFSMPQAVNEILPGSSRPPISRVRSWTAAEEWQTLAEFSATLQRELYRDMINCLDWQVASPLMFHGPGDSRAVQAVRVRFVDKGPGSKYREVKAPRRTLSGIDATRTREAVFTFCLEKRGKRCASGAPIVMAGRHLVARYSLLWLPWPAEYPAETTWSAYCCVATTVDTPVGGKLVLVNFLKLTGACVLGRRQPFPACCALSHTGKFDHRGSPWMELASWQIIVTDHWLTYIHNHRDTVTLPAGGDRGIQGLLDERWNSHCSLIALMVYYFTNYRKDSLTHTVMHVHDHIQDCEEIRQDVGDSEFQERNWQ
eukprot:jgi/Mesvir1/5720/Mv09823-RA.1